MHRRRFLAYGVACVGLYVCFVVVFAGYATHRAKRESLESVDTQLLLAAKALKYMLAPDFHDRAIDEDAIGRDEELRNREAVSEFAFETDFEYVYTLAEKDGKFYFAAPTVTPEEAEEIEKWYFYPYEDIPEEFVAAYNDGILRFATYSDQWGTFRSVAIPETSPGGRRYLACADYDIGYIRAFLIRRCAFYLLAAMGFLLVSLPFVLLTRRMYKTYNSQLVAVNRELTQHREHLEQLVDARTTALRKAAREAQQASQAKTEFLNNVSHEIRTPLNAIIGFSEMILHDDPPEQIQARATTILSESEGLLAIIDDILDNAKIEAGKMVIDPFPFELDALLGSIRRNAEAQFRRKGLDLRIDTGPGIPNLLRGDAFRLRQVLLNLVANAMKFTERGSVTVQVSVDSREPESVRLRFAVIDTGIGIRKERQRAIFESFTQDDGSTTRRFGGTGLGTTISQKLVSLMGGEMGLESEVGRGSTFWFTVPLGICSPGEARSFANTPDADRMPVWLVPGYVYGQYERDLDTPVPASEGRILVGEDYEPNRQVAVHHLTSAGYGVDVAANGGEAVAACQEARYDLILMDIQMPEMDGYEATRRIRQLGGHYETVPILAMTAHADAKTRRVCLDSGFDDVIAKPIRRQSFIQTVTRWLAHEVPHAGVQAEAPSGGGPPAGGAPILDYAEALYQFSGERAVLDETLDVFAQDLEQAIRDMDRALAGSDAGTIRRRAHQIRGGAGNLRAVRLSAAATEVEEAAECDRITALPELIDALRREAGLFIDYWRRSREGGHSHEDPRG